MCVGKQIIKGLREAIAHARGDCQHEWTYWAPNLIPAGCSEVNSWSRICTKCKMRETSFVKTAEIAEQT